MVNSYRGDKEIFESLKIISETLKQELTQFNKELITEALLTIGNKKPDILKNLKEVLLGTISGASGNVIGQWLINILNSLPK